MEVRAITRYVRISPSKAAEISRLIQGKTVTEALAIVEISPRKAARLFAKTLKSAIANAENSDKNQYCGVCGARLPDIDDADFTSLEDNDYYTESNQIFNADPSNLH